MSDSLKKTEIVPNKLIDLLVSDIFSKYGVDKEQVKGRLSEEKKQILKEMVEDLSKRVNQFVSENNAKKRIVNFLKVPILRRFLFDKNSYIP
ncbi:spore coat protein [Priestia megaterium]|uniref:spore coat protein n=1 Tax=Priestia megaterium TaxID=1404 RepID=UPI00207AFFE2|nr:spore coat protein [Priestia megaterium]USL45774.1 spore coat protein [Priestia megaterium]